MKEKIQKQIAALKEELAQLEKSHQQMVAGFQQAQANFQQQVGANQTRNHQIKGAITELEKLIEE